MSPQSKEKEANAERHSADDTVYSATEAALPLDAKQDASTGFTEADWALDKATLSRMDWSILPLVAMVYLLSFLE